MDTKLWSALRTGGLALALLLGAASVAPAAAQTETADEPVAAQTSDTEEDDGGFDDWGLLGLLGLAGLAGLARRPARNVVVDPTPTRRT